MEFNLDTQYRAFVAYKANSKVDARHLDFVNVYRSINKIEDESVKIIYSTCTIEEDWILAIEKGIPFLEKAIREERQFIRSEGEVLPIEKVRKTSAESVRDLARHANYITHLPNENSVAAVQPDKMLVIKKDSDYSVYENRVVYATLIYLKDFIVSRLNKIKDATNKYNGAARIVKNINLGNRQYDFSFEMKETRNDDFIAMRNNSFQGLIDRINECLSNVIVLLRTPLMTQVGKSDLVKRPITKTNVLKMNTNFRESLACFDWVANYGAPGFTIKTVEKELNPLQNKVSADYAEAFMLLSFITYMHNNNISDELQADYLKEEERRKKEEEDKQLERLAKLVKEAKEKGLSKEEYILSVLDGFKVLQDRNAAKERELKLEAARQAKEVAELKSNFEVERLSMEANKQKELAKARADANAEIEKGKAEHRGDLVVLAKAQQEEIDALNSQHLEADIARQSEIAELRKQIEELNKKLDDEQFKVTLIKGEYTALKAQMNKNLANDEDYTSKEKIAELEEEKAAFERFFKANWNKTKKKIRKQMLDANREAMKEARDNEKAK